VSIRVRSPFRQQPYRRPAPFKPARRTEEAQDLLLVACGLFQTYVAVFDSSIFQLITGGNLSSRLVVSAATVLAAGVPFFFALGALKEGALPAWSAVFFYEKLLKGPGFWVLSALFMLSLIPILFLEGRLYSSGGAVLAGLSLCVAAYLLVAARRRIQSQL